MKRLFILSAFILSGVFLAGGLSDSTVKEKASIQVVEYQGVHLSGNGETYVLNNVYAEVAPVLEIYIPEFDKVASVYFEYDERLSERNEYRIRPPPELGQKSESIS